MATTVDSLNITGMKPADFEQLYEIFHHFKDTGIYWGRKDYFDARMIRLEIFIDSAVVSTCDSDIRIPVKKDEQ